MTCRSDSGIPPAVANKPAAEAGRLGLALVADGDGLTIKGLRGAMPAEFLDNLRASKPDLIELPARSSPSANVAAREALEGLDALDRAGL